MTILLGAIADDFTGATDLANTLVKQGMRTVQVIGVPDETTSIGDAQAVVVALKSRTAPREQAVEWSLNALIWLKAQGASQFISKYCSTFDSTSDGNIGPIADALIEELAADFALVCPAFPENGRTIYQGNLYVGAELLSESSMRDHPLTPMRDSNLVRLMDAQSDRKVGLIPWTTVRAGVQDIEHAIEELKASGFTYGVADALTEADLENLGKAAASHQLVTGGSGIALGLPENFRKSGLLKPGVEPSYPAREGRKLVLAGSCSTATRQQLAAINDQWSMARFDADQIAEGRDVAAELTDWAKAQDPALPVVIYASADPEEVARVQQKYGREAAGEMVESTMGKIASTLVGNGFDQLVVAGGETSGAVVSALGVKALSIGREIAPGVPWTETTGKQSLALALKSGNFGGPKFFEEAFSVLS